MKKLLILGAIIALSACTYGGGINLSGGSNGTNLGVNFGTGVNIRL